LDQRVKINKINLQVNKKVRDLDQLNYLVKNQKELKCQAKNQKLENLYQNNLNQILKAYQNLKNLN
jgi:hypothetical protein